MQLRDRQRWEYAAPNRTVRKKLERQQSNDVFAHPSKNRGQKIAILPEIWRETGAFRER